MVDDSTIAAVDLGSNSFHMVVARVVKGRVELLDRLRERVALAEGLDEQKGLTAEAQARALQCLERFGQRVRHMPRGSVRAVGTNTLRQAKRGRSFLSKARQALGHPIDVISGREEARLIYLGVAHSLPSEPGRRLVVDIGGGSTECVVGDGFDVKLADSLYMGCVSYSRRYFPGGCITSGTMEEAKVAARRELEPIEGSYRALGWRASVGSSGTVLAIDEILRRQGWSADGITAVGLSELRMEMVRAGWAERVRLQGLEEDRRAVLPGGVAICSAVVEAFAVERMIASTGALREGVIYDLLGRLAHEDVRDRTIRDLGERYGADPAQAARVETTALALYDQCRDGWQLDSGTEMPTRQILSWAARLHEIGLAVSYAGHHKHGAYLAEHSDMPGFAVGDQGAVAALVRTHRRKLPRRAFEDFGADGPRLERLCLLLRLAVLLNRSRSARAVPAAAIAAAGERVLLRLPREWLEAHPLTRADLDDEARELARAGYALECAALDAAAS